MSIILNFYRRLPAFKGKFRLGKLLFASLINKNYPIWCKGDNGLAYYLPNTVENIGTEILINGTYEPETIQFITKRLPQKGILFDIGANIGAIALPLAKVNKEIEVYAFEPSAFTFQFLENNIRKNQCQNVHIFQLAVNNKHNATCQFFASDTLHGKSSFAPVFAKDSQEVRTISLDKFCEEKAIEKIDFMKVDVEGFEVSVFQGAQNMLDAKKIKQIYFEFVDWAEKNAGFEVGAAQHVILNSGYRLFMENGEQLFSPITTGSKMLLAIA